MTEPDPVSSLRHDLRTPLTIVAGFAELLAGERPLSEEERRDYARRIVAAANEMRRLLDATESGPSRDAPPAA